MSTPTPKALLLCAATVTISLVLGSIGFILSMTKKGPPSSMQVDEISIGVKLPLFEAGRRTAMNVKYVNFGPGDAFDVEWNFQLVLQRMPVSATVEEAIWTDFRKATYDKEGLDIAVGRNVWTTRFTQVLTEQDVTDLEEGRLLLYLLAFMTYRDGTGERETQLCRWLQPPGDKAIWHHCREHNRIK